MESGERDLIPLSRCYFFHVTKSPLFFSVAPLITIHFLSVHEEIIYSRLRRSFTPVDCQSSGTGAAIFFFSRVRVKWHLQCWREDRVKGWRAVAVSEVTERVGKLPGRCKERRNPLEVGWWWETVENKWGRIQAIGAGGGGRRRDALLSRKKNREIARV